MILLTILGLALFEIVSSIDNAVINAEVLADMQPKSRKWFLTWGFLFAVVMIRGILPWLIIWITAPSLGPIGSLTATFSGDSSTRTVIEEAAPVLLQAGGVFLVFLFLHWLFLEEKQYGLPTEKYFAQKSEWFYALGAMIVLALTYQGLRTNAALSVAALCGFAVFAILQLIKNSAEKTEKELTSQHKSDTSKLIYLEIIDSVFSVDGVLGAFAFTLSVPLILLGNGLGALVVRSFTQRNADVIKKYSYLKNGAMYSILFLGIVMLLNSLGHPVPEYASPLITFIVVSFFFFRSKQNLESSLP